jgi:DNA repair exonuclease SbcCD ATPase subunit/DNA repair exonuclease SbcCD nuclease subunit
MKILMTGDWHLDMGNLPYTVPAIEAGLAAAPSFDVFVHAGDLVVNRSSVHPHVSREVRRLIQRGSFAAAHGGIVVAGNHDQSFHAERVGMVEGILAGQDEHGDGFLQLAATPRVIAHPFTDDRSPAMAAFVCIPTPNKYWAKARAEEGADVNDLMATMVRGLIGEARMIPFCRNVVVIYHGTLGGATLGDERQMPSGVDLQLPAAAFAGADIVLAGHIHHRQDIPATAAAPRILYCGAPAPLTWNDQKLEPGMWVVTLDGTPDVRVDLLRLPVVSQLIHMDVDAEAGDQVNEMVADAVVTRAGRGDRARVCVHAPAAVIDTIDHARAREMGEALGLQALKVISERTDSSTARTDIGTGASILDALQRWAEMKKIEGAPLAGLQALGAEIEERVKDRHLDARYEMKPLALTVENWCQYAEAHVDFSRLSGLVVVEGPNYSGKSNISRAVLFALYKRQVSGNRLDDLIRKGADWMRVTFDFESGGKTYRIIREAKRTSRGATAALHFLDITAPDAATGGAIPVAEGTARETQDAIERLIGPAELFLATAFAGQNEVDALLDLTPGEMKDLLMQVLQRDFASRQKEGTACRTAAEAEARRARDQVAAIEASIVSRTDGPDLLPALRSRLDERRADLAEHEAGAAKATAELEAARTRAGQREATLATAQRAAEQAGQAERRQRALLDRMRELQAGQDACDAVVDRGLPTGGMRTTADIEADLADLPALEAAATALLRADLDDCRRVRAERTSTAQAASRAAQAAATAAERANRDLVEAARQAALIDRVPCEGDRLYSHPDPIADERDCGACQFLTDAKAAKARIPELALAHDHAIEDADNRDADARRAAEALTLVDAEIAEREQEIAAAGRQAEDRRAAMLQQLAAAVAADRQAREYREALERKSHLAADRLQIGQDLAPLAAEIQRLRAEAAQADSMHEALISSGITIHACEVVAARFQASAAECRTEIERTVGAIAGAEARAASVAEDSHRVSVLREAATWHDNTAAIAALYCDAVNRDGIPFLMLEQFSIPTLQAVANEYLAGTGLSVQVEAERELQTGESRNAVEITYTDHRGRHPKGAASGSQRFHVGGSLRYGIAELTARATGSRMWLAVQDEGFGTLDPDNLEASKATLRNIAAKRGTFLVISHVPGMSEVADHVLRVVDDGGTSRVEVL